MYKNLYEECTRVRPAQCAQLRNVIAGRTPSKVVLLSGPTASWKSTLVEAVESALETETPGAYAIGRNLFVFDGGSSYCENSKDKIVDVLMLYGLTKPLGGYAQAIVRIDFDTLSFNALDATLEFAKQYSNQCCNTIIYETTLSTPQSQRLKQTLESHDCVHIRMPSLQLPPHLEAETQDKFADIEASLTSGLRPRSCSFLDSASKRFPSADRFLEALSANAHSFCGDDDTHELSCPHCRGSVWDNRRGHSTWDAFVCKNKNKCGWRQRLAHPPPSLRRDEPTSIEAHAGLLDTLSGAQHMLGSAWANVSEDRLTKCDAYATALGALGTVGTGRTWRRSSRDPLTLRHQRHEQTSEAQKADSLSTSYSEWTGVRLPRQESRQTAVAVCIAGRGRGSRLYSDE